jgi:hypothetical protein
MNLAFQSKIYFPMIGPKQNIEEPPLESFVSL